MTATAEAMAELQRGTVEMAAHIGEALKRLDRLKDADAIVGRIEKLHASMNLRPTLFGIRRVPTQKPPEPDAG